MALTKTSMGLADPPPEGPPTLERLIDGFWGIDAFIDQIRERIEAELKDGKSPFVRIYITDRET